LVAGMAGRRGEAQVARVGVDKQDRRGLGAGDLLGGVHDVVEQRLQPRGGVHDAANLKQATENVEFALEGNRVVLGLWRVVGQVGQSSLHVDMQRITR